MTTGIDLSWFDPEAVAAEQQQKQRELFAIVHGDDAKAAACAAAELLRWHARFGLMEAPEVQAAIEEGAVRVLQKVAKAGLEKDGRTWIRPIDYFVVEPKPADGPRKSGVNQQRLDLRAAHGDFLSKDEALRWLTERPAKRGKGQTMIPPAERAKTIGELEQWLVRYVEQQYPHVEKEECRSFVRQSFPNVRWSKPGAGVGWDTP